MGFGFFLRLLLVCWERNLALYRDMWRGMVSRC